MAKATKPEAASESTYIVVKPFRDKGNFNKEYKIGEDVSGFDKARLAHLVSIEHVEEVKPVATIDSTDAGAKTGSEQ